MSRNCLWDCYWGCACQLLVNVFPPVLSNSPRGHCETFLLVSNLQQNRKNALDKIPEMFVIVNKVPTK